MPPTPDPRMALVAAQQEFEATRGRLTQLRQVANNLRELRRQNHFAERIRLAYERS